MDLVKENGGIWLCSLINSLCLCSLYWLPFQFRSNGCYRLRFSIFFNGSMANCNGSTGQRRRNRLHLWIYCVLLVHSDESRYCEEFRSKIIMLILIDSFAYSSFSFIIKVTKRTISPWSLLVAEFSSISLAKTLKYIASTHSYPINIHQEPLNFYTGLGNGAAEDMYYYGSSLLVYPFD